jgi:hypothetical protein
MSQEAGGRQRPDPDTVRTEAERLVATGLAAMSMAADRIGAPTRERGGAAAASFDALGDMLFGPAGHRQHSVANDSPACCRCPVCRVIAAARQPSPTFAEKLATGVGFMAEGAARVLRGVAGAASGAASAARPASSPAPAPPPAEPDPWAAATTEPPAPAATTEPPAPGPAPAPAMTVPPPAAPAKKTAKKTVSKKAVAKRTVSKNAVAKKAPRPKKTSGDAGQ